MFPLPFNCLGTKMSNVFSLASNQSWVLTFTMHWPFKAYPSLSPNRQVKPLQTRRLHRPLLNLWNSARPRLRRILLPRRPQKALPISRHGKQASHVPLHRQPRGRRRLPGARKQHANQWHGPSPLRRLRKRRLHKQRKGRNCRSWRSRHKRSVLGVLRAKMSRKLTCGAVYVSGWRDVAYEVQEFPWVGE